MHPEAGCPVGLSVYALPKTGSSFLGRFLKALAVHLHVCMVLELKVGCGTMLRVGCPPEWGGRRNILLSACVPKADGCSWGWLMSHTHELDRRCCSLNQSESDALLPQTGSASQPGDDSGFVECSRQKLASVMHEKRLPGASGTLRTVLSSAGFVRGPLRQLSPSMDNFLPVLQQRRIVVLHARHPIEAMVSLFYCISDPAVCPVRQNVSNTPASATHGLDSFLLRDLEGPPTSHLNRLLVKYEVLASLWQQSQRGSSFFGRGMPAIVQSRYELMVEDFSSWVSNLLDALPLPQPVQKIMLHSLLRQYRGEFEPDGKHKHSLRAGSNLDRVRHQTLNELGEKPRLRAILQILEYSLLKQSDSLLMTYQNVTSWKRTKKPMIAEELKAKVDLSTPPLGDKEREELHRLTALWISKCGRPQAIVEDSELR
ncbi:hypothetical protein AB1Y20_019356 [Prymnesium parvum]|uniref:Protein-tyrosine sulfotransferase n=1 Tax=Prymnesium parvum TaxID=97485 RepID=A0AB34JUD4_PRYPA